MWYQFKQALVQSTQQFLTRAARLLPEAVAFIVVLLTSVIVAWILAILIRRLLDGMHVDKWAVRWGFPALGDDSPMTSASLLISRTVAGAVVIIGFLLAVSAFDVESVSALVRTAFGYVPNVIGAFLVLIIGMIVARFLARSVLIGAVNMNFQYGRLLSVGVKWLVIVLSVAMALEHLRIAPGIVEIAFGILFGGIVLTLALGIGLNSKELVSKSFDRDVKRESPETIEEPFHHL
jgi:hypothetical protein